MQTFRSLQSRSPLFAAAVAFAGGILTGTVFGMPLWILVPVFFASVFAAALAGKARGPVLLFAMFAAGLVVQAADVPGPDRIVTLFASGSIDAETPLVVRGRLTRDPEPAIGGRFVEIETESVRVARVNRKASGRIRLFAAAGTPESAADLDSLALAGGDRIEAICRLDREDRFRNPGTMVRARQLESQGIDTTGIVKSPLLFKKLSSGAGFGSAISGTRDALIRVVRATFDPPTAGVLVASMLGNKEYLDRDTAELFRDGGTFHILVISGLHITFIGGLVVGALRLFRQGRRRQLLIAGTIVWTYALAVGGEVPVVRAAFMFTLYLLGRALYRDGNALNLFGLSAIVMLAIRPADLFSASFQLTFLSVGAIVGAAFPLVEKLRAIGEWHPTSERPFPPSTSRALVRLCEAVYWRDPIWKAESARNIWSARISKSARAPRFGAALVRFAFEGVMISFIVQIALLPLSVWYFNRVPFGSIALNLWVGPILAIESFAATAALLASGVSETLAAPLIAVTNGLNALLLAGPRSFAAIGAGGFRTPVYTGVWSSMYPLHLAPLAILSWRLARWDPFALNPDPRKTYRLPLVFAAVLTMVIAFHPLAAPRADGRLRIDFIDVGQGDSALLTFPDGTTMLIDGGGRPNYAARSPDGFETEPFDPDRPTIGETVVSRFLWHRGLSKLDYIVATHADADHIQGLADVARNFSVRQALFGHFAADDPEFKTLIKVLEQKGIAYSPVSRGEAVEIGGARVEVLHPKPDGPGGNDDSVVIRVAFGRRVLLFTGDIEAGGERSILEADPDLRADVVKVAHHGSRTSSIDRFVESAKAKIAVISVGRNSPFGHPNGEVVERWLGSGAKVLTTGESGTISVSTDGFDIEVATFVRETGPSASKR